MFRKELFMALGLYLAGSAAQAGIDKVYSPTVETGEWELELRGTTSRDDNPDRDHQYKQKVGLGYGVAERLFIEGYVITEKEPGEEATIEAFEFEALLQLTEQGEYPVDLGFLTELERERRENVWEVKGGPILQTQAGNWLATANLLLEEKFGRDHDGEEHPEFLGAAQLRYRLMPTIEPAVEYYYDDHTQAVGPVLLGAFRMGRMRIKWEAGVLFGLADETPDQTARWLLEIEY